MQEVRFFQARKRFLYRSKSSRKGLSSYEIYLRKRASQLKNAAEIESNGAILNYLDWIKGIQNKLKLSNTQFAARLNLSCQSIKLWYRKSGHLPSEKTFKKLLQLEREANIPIRELKLRIGIRYGR